MYLQLGAAQLTPWALHRSEGPHGMFKGDLLLGSLLPARLRHHGSLPGMF